MAGMMGAAGVVLAAGGAHVTAGSGLDSAAYMLLFHGVAVLGGAALLEQGQLWRPIGARRARRIGARRLPVLLRHRTTRLRGSTPVCNGSAGRRHDPHCCLAHTRGRRHGRVGAEMTFSVECWFRRFIRQCVPNNCGQVFFQSRRQHGRDNAAYASI